MGNSLPRHETVNGTRFGVVKHIAEGGFSNVFEVKDAKTKARYALKRVRCGDEEAVEAAKVCKERPGSHALPHRHPPATSAPSTAPAQEITLLRLRLRACTLLA
jgi:serine/threonine protein kinase